ncbi:MAG: SH3 domain-containing protein [Treponema sp.]|nr:SH3 domain-containing protein [Treponema sp.]
MAKRFLTFLLLAGLSLAAFAAGASRYVSVQSLAVKEKASGTSRTLMTVSYGDELTVVKESGKWTQVTPKSNPSVTGWVNSSALSKRKIVAGKAVKTDANEISLAGKGFAEGLDTRQTDDWNSDYAAVDAVEGNAVPEADVDAFVREGKLKEAE